MTRVFAPILAVALLLAALCSAHAQKVYPQRWVYVSRNQNRDRDVEDIRAIVETASEHGLNGMVLTGGFDTMDLRDEAYFRRLEQVQAICRDAKIEIIPIIFSIGYGSAILAHNPNLAAGIPVQDALFVVKGDQANLVPDPPVAVVNGDFEQFEGDRFAAYDFHDDPGKVSFVDQQAPHGGKACIRFENFQQPNGHARIMEQITVHPHRYYRVSLWVKTEDLDPPRSFAIQVYDDRHCIAPVSTPVRATQDWTKVQMAFNSLGNEKVKLYAGLWGGRSGKLWLDDFSIEELGFTNVLRRPGTPVTVKSEDGTVTYEEGKDYEKVVDPQLHPSRADHDGPPLHILPDSRIKDGQRLRVSFYHSLGVNDGQVTVCMSEPEVYDILRKTAETIHEHLGARKFLLSMDEIRAGGGCAACKARHMTMGEILGDCITKEVQILRDTTPAAEVYIWSDMLDPNHNAHGDYYLVDGDFTGSWEHVPKDLIIACWYYEKREQSLKFFSDLGFRTLAGAYYDGDSLDNCRGWLEALDRTPNALGIMYTTWRDKYDLLGPFGDLVTKR
jgi:hypothetical protein